MEYQTDEKPFGRPLAEKSSLEEIRQRFDQDVERFSRLETGQQAIVDAPLVLELVAQCARRHLKPDDRVLDLGCGAGNFTLRVLQEVSPLECHLADLRRPMLERAQARIRATGVANVTMHQKDLRHLDLASNSMDCILAGAVLHHLRDHDDWRSTFVQLHHWLKPGGRLYVADLTIFDVTEIQELMWHRYGSYLDSLGGAAYRDKVTAYVEKEDSPRSLPFQFEMLRQAGFSQYDVLHRNGLYSCYFATK